jgi:hypothetical protein
MIVDVDVETTSVADAGSVKTTNESGTGREELWPLLWTQKDDEEIRYSNSFSFCVAFNPFQISVFAAQIHRPAFAVNARTSSKSSL